MPSPPTRTRFAERVGAFNDEHAIWLQPALTATSGIVLSLSGLGVGFFVAGCTLAGVLVASQIGSAMWARQVARRVAAEHAEQMRLAEEESTAVYLEAVRRFSLLAETLEPVQRAAATMARESAADRRVSFDRLTVELLDAIRFVYQVEGLRAVLYTFDDDGQALELVRQVSHGRREPAGPFRPDTTRGAKAIKLAKSGVPLFVPDIMNAPEEWEGSGHGYNTFIAYPITSATTAYGLLTVDAPLTDDLTEENKSEIGLVAGIAAVIFANLRRR